MLLILWRRAFAVGPAAGPRLPARPHAYLDGHVTALELYRVSRHPGVPSHSCHGRARAALVRSHAVLWKGTLYFDSPFDQIFAVDAATGRLRWKFDPKINREGGIYILTSRGVACGMRRSPRRAPAVPTWCSSPRWIVAARTGCKQQAMPARNWYERERGSNARRRHPHHALLRVHSPPTIVGDTVVLGSTVADNQSTYVASGAVRGFDIRTGAQKWMWEPLPWAAAQHPRNVGSGNAWAPMAADPEHDLVFVPTGSPSVDFYGGTRPGDNRDADSLVALQASTGRRVWAFQLVHHDIWDYDTPSQPVLFTFRGSTPAVAITTKTGMVYVFNRLTGKPLYPIEERPVAASTLPGEQASPTQPFSTLPALTPLSFTAADLHLADPADQKYCTAILNRLDNHGLFTPPSARGSLVNPGSIGGANRGSAAFDPTTSLLYTRVSTMPYMVRE